MQLVEQQCQDHVRLHVQAAQLHGDQVQVSQVPTQGRRRVARLLSHIHDPQSKRIPHQPTAMHGMAWHGIAPPWRRIALTIAPHRKGYLLHGGGQEGQKQKKGGKFRELLWQELKKTRESSTGSEINGSQEKGEERNRQYTRIKFDAHGEKNENANDNGDEDENDNDNENDNYDDNDNDNDDENDSDDDNDNDNENKNNRPDKKNTRPNTTVREKAQEQEQEREQAKR